MSLFGGVIPITGITFLMFSLLIITFLGYALGRISIKGVIVKNELEGNKNVVLDTSFNSEQLAEMAGVEVPTAVITETEC